jgi:hypothetical protein
LLAGVALDQLLAAATVASDLSNSCTAPLKFPQSAPDRTRGDVGDTGDHHRTVATQVRARTSLAANSRRPRSSSVGRSSSWWWRTTDLLLIRRIYIYQAVERFGSLRLQTSDSIMPTYRLSE